MYEYILYILLIIVIIILCVIGYIKIKFKFWCIQPVFHIYDFQYYIFPPGIILYELPERNKFCNFKNIETTTYSVNLSEIQITKFIHFIRQHYLQNKENVFIPEKENIIPYFEGHNSPSFLSFYNEKESLIDTKSNSVVEGNKIISVMTGRPIHVVINNNKDAFFDAYYIDYLCVDKNQRKNGIAPQMIQTHEYNARHLNKNIKVSIFKREGELTGIVPICVYSTYGFDMKLWKKPQSFSANINLIECGSTNIHHLFDFIKMQSSKFDISMITETSNLMELIKTKNIYIYMIIQEDKVISAYFFRKTNTFVNKKAESLCCFSSIQSQACDNDIFIHGYKIALWTICEKSKTLNFAVLEEISDNKIIIDNLILKNKPSVISPTAYFFYNFAYYTFNSKKVFIIN